MSKRQLGLVVAVVAEPDALDSDRAPVPVHLPVEHAAVLELRAQVGLGHAPRQLQVAPAGPLRVVGDPRLRGQPTDHGERAHAGLAGELGVGADPVRAERMVARRGGSRCRPGRRRGPRAASASSRSARRARCGAGGSVPRSPRRRCRPPVSTRTASARRNGRTMGEGSAMSPRAIRCSSSGSRGSSSGT